MMWFKLVIVPLWLLLAIDVLAVAGLYDLSRYYKLIDPPAKIASKSNRIRTDQYIEQKIDNFNPTDTRTYLQRYHISEVFYNNATYQKNHIFLLLGGEWEATPNWLSGGSWLNSAEEHGALMIYLEHRYYGLSHPFPDLSTENLQYLNAHQALEDAATFIHYINEQYGLSTDEAKWIVFGGSYAGTLATWLRHKYPHLVAGAVDSSGPLDAILDFHQYYQVVRESLETHSENCSANVQEAFNQLEELVDGCLEDSEVYEYINDLFRLCVSIENSEGNEKDISTFFGTIASSNFAYTVQYNGRLLLSIDDVCNVMVNGTDGSTALERLGKVHQQFLNSQGYSCTSYSYDDNIAYYQNTTITASGLYRQWLYQTCTEYGFYQTSSQADPIFGSKFDINYYTDLCVDIYGTHFNETLIKQGINATNIRYGGNTTATSRVVHFHGKIDPWYPLGRLETTEDADDAVIMVEGVSHCASMYLPVEGDPEGLGEAINEIDRLIGVWLMGLSDQSEANSSSSKSLLSFYTVIIILINYLVC